MPQSQAAQLAAKLPAPQTANTDGARVIIPSILQLTRKQEDNLMEHAKLRLRQLKDELGRHDYTGQDWMPHAAAHMKKGLGTSFFARRHLAHMVYNQRMEWRSPMLKGIWQESNLHLPLTRRNVQQQIAKTNSYYFGSDPWVSCRPVGLGDSDYAKKVDRWGNHEVRESDLASTLAKTIELTFIQGEQVVKTTYDRQISYYKTAIEVAVDNSGKPLLALDGDYITRRDTFVPLDPSQGSNSKQVLARDMRTPAPLGTLTFQKTEVEKRFVSFSGARPTNVHYLDFLAPLTAPSLERADVNIHLYSEPVIALAARLLESSDEWADQVPSPEEQLARISTLCRQLLPGAGDSQRPAAQQSRSDQGEGPQMTGNDRYEPEASLAEVWMHYDVLGDGNVCSIMLLMDSEGRVPIYYNYAANLTWNGLRPFREVAINKVAGRWHGQGQVENFYNLQHFADLLINRWNFHQTRAARVDFWNPSHVEEGNNNPNLLVNWGGTYRLKPNSTAAQALSSVYLQDTKSEHTQNLLQMIIQMVTNMGGVASVNDSQMAGLETSALATGVKDLQQNNQELSGQWIADTKPSLRRIVADFMGLTLAHLDKPRVYRYFEYDPNVQDFVSRTAYFTPDDAKDLSLDCDFNLSRYTKSDDIQQSNQTWTLSKEFYALPPMIQAALQPAARKVLQDFGVNNPEQYITAMQDPQMPAMGQPPAPGAPASAPMPDTAVQPITTPPRELAAL